MGPVVKESILPRGRRDGLQRKLRTVVDPDCLLLLLLLHGETLCVLSRHVEHYSSCSYKGDAVSFLAAQICHGKFELYVTLVYVLEDMPIVRK